MGSLMLAFGLVVLAWLLVAGSALREWRPTWYWYLTGYPVAAARVVFTWRKVAHLNDLSVSYRPNQVRVGGLAVKGEALRPRAPRISFPRATPNGLSVVVRLHPGQTPLRFMAAAEALAHAWRVFAVRVISPERGIVHLVATAVDPLAAPGAPPAPAEAVLLTALVGLLESGREWVMDFRRVPHWLIVGATRSGKSTLLARLVTELAPQRVALVGIDCKGGMELGIFGPRLSALATNRREALVVLSALVVDLQERMRVCRMAGARSIWDLPEIARPIPVVVIVDEIAELYLTSGGREDKAEAEQCSTYLLRIAQLGAALGVHLVVAGQRVGSDLGPGVTALRAQLGGRICHRVNDPGTAEMTLGDLNKDAAAVAQSITPGEQGVAVTTADDGGWVRGRSHLTTVTEAQAAAARYADRAPKLRAFANLPTEGTA
ncbi:FtsK/SpoIIIE domain-containing protein [Streptomyces sp. H10-C2]|uniref:FtsK/SpoIIIE domain-containing protein n=1 Tax=unclassified Streptomyces TaxID=2593676 RepID=UPI0024BB1662|nr:MULTISPECIES: FtsK/SpoIIIE domain-containing protein [unclassified Streptomyces]MDJ0341390.1 FtsK/SpoIIIE domain-containing protein [Streptomyces sp. PH10-H1]MDJ0370985.1 FtsK/SpoIIIE domain-containing protein [Streptomyces sp. H10-C2]